ncbi:MAG: carbohydrate kinase family protein [Haloarculaceae archaeon]
MRVVCAGHVNWDVTLFVDRVPTPEVETRIERRHQSGGGSAANVAVALCALGEPAGLIGSVGDDEHGLFARRSLADAGVDLGGVRVVPGDTAVKYLLVPADGDVCVMGTGGANERVRPADVDPDYVARADHCHLTSQRPATASRLAALADDAGATVSFDPGRRAADRDYGAVYDRADLLFVNEHEAAAVPTGTDAVVVTKYGGAGASARADGATVDHPGYGVDPVDTAGAGDAFAAGFLAAWLDGADLRGALATGNACGAVAARHEGAQVRLDPAAVRTLRDEGGR